MTDPRIESLEAQVAWQEQTIGELNATILELWNEIAALRRDQRKLEEQVRNVESGLPEQPDRPPPHY